MIVMEAFDAARWTNTPRPRGSADMLSINGRHIGWHCLGGMKSVGGKKMTKTGHRLAQICKSPNCIKWAKLAKSDTGK
jgi:hypothetical protein